MTYVIAGACIADYSCVEACPVDCIHPMPDETGYATTEQLYIDPKSCIDCGACVEACPVDTVFPADDLPDRWAHFKAINEEHFALLQVKS
jgi:NAD-dependent dihydropyrimidine dehydrogenase PreA subunit